MALLLKITAGMMIGGAALFTTAFLGAAWPVAATIGTVFALFTATRL